MIGHFDWNFSFKIVIIKNIESFKYNGYNEDDYNKMNLILKTRYKGWKHMRRMEGNYKITETIYNSPNNTVFKASNIEKNETVIIKTLNNDPISISKMKNEYELLKKLQGDHVVKVHKFLKFENKISIVIEDFGAIRLSEYIKNNDMQIKELLDIALKITKCIKYIHSKHVIL